MTFSIDQFRLDGKVAVVTGAGGRGNSIGRAYALGLGNAGAAVVVADLNAEGAKAVSDEIIAAGGKAIAVGVDITKPDSVATHGEGRQRCLRRRRYSRQQRGADGGAGLAARRRHSARGVEPHHGCQRDRRADLRAGVVPLMRARGGGKIVNQVSGGAFPAMSVYGISKLALGRLDDDAGPPARAREDQRQRHRARATS